MNAEQSLLALEPQPIRGEEKSITEALHSFSEFGKATKVERFPNPEIELPVFINEFWSSKQKHSC